MARRPWKMLVLLAGCFGFLTSISQAGVLPFSVTVSGESGNTRYNYGVVVTSASVLKTGDFFTIFDFAHPIEGSNLQPAGFTFSSSLTGGSPTSVSAGDNPNIPNLTWTYNGPTPIPGASEVLNFSVLSSSKIPGTSNFTARSHTKDDVIDSNITDTLVPLGSLAEPPVMDPIPDHPDAPPGVPEPATLALLAAGLPLAIFARRRKNKIVA